jgi:hypothetical protein
MIAGRLGGYQVRRKAFNAERLSATKGTKVHEGKPDIFEGLGCFVRFGEVAR